jgi:hypothetical protein
MHDIVNSDLAARFASGMDETHREPVVVTSDRPLDRQALAAAGMDVTFVSTEGTIASGTVDGKALEQLAALGGVVRIEADTEMHALDD